MSSRNGDKSRHTINKRRVRANRVRIRALVKAKAGQPQAAKAAK